MKSFFAIFIVFLLARCAQVGDDRPVPVLEKERSAPLDTQELLADLVATEIPNVFHAKLSWPEAPAQASGWKIVRHCFGERQKNFGPFPESVREFVDESLTPEQLYTYSLFLIDEGGSNRLIAMNQVVAPTDLVVNTTMPPPAATLFHRVFLKPGGQIVLEGKDLTLEVDELIADGGSIVSFPSGATAALGSDGRSGGSLNLRAEKARGHLHIVGHGEFGGKGTSGARGQPGNPGAKGRNAEIRLNDLGRSLENQLPRYEQIYPPCEQWWMTVYTCRTVQTDGQDGGPGGRGNDGAPGGRGGDTLKALVSITSAEGFELTWEGEPGIGGGGGAPGEGGAGGAAGAPGDPDRHCICEKGVRAPGKPGPGGTAGNLGPAGASGTRLIPEFKIGQ